MNLATRWRDAISQLSMMKKEVVLQQRKAAAAIAENQKLQQQQLQMTNHDSPSSIQQRNQLQNQTPPKATPSTAIVEKSPGVPPSARAGPSFHDVAAEMDRMDRILAAHQSQSKQNQIPPPPPPPAKTGQGNQFTAESLVTSPSLDSKDSMDSNTTAESDGEEKKSQSMDQPVTPSPDKGSRSFDSNDSDNNEENGDLEEEAGNFFARYKASTPVDLDDLDDEDLDDADDVDDPELSPPSVTPSESPPPSPPQSLSPSPETPSPESFDNLDTIASEGSMQGVNETSAPLFPMTASPKLMPKPKVYNDVFPPDITSEVVRHPRSAERRGMVDSFNEIEEEDAVGITSMRTTSNAGGGAEAASPPSLSDFDDVFENSFATKFPDSFSPSDDKFDVDSNDEEDYNPFFPSQESSGSPHGDNKSTESSNSRSNMRFGQADNALSPVNVGRHRPASPETFQPSPGTALFQESPSSTWASSQRSSPPNASPSRSSDNHNSIANTDSPPKEGTLPTQGARYATPPHGLKSPDVILSDEPKRPEKSGAAAARARYEKALQPRGFQVGGARRFARRAETDHGASPVNAPSTSLSSSSQSLKDQREENNGVQVDTSKLAMAQARVKERTAVFSGRTTLSTLESKTYSSVRENKWTRPSPTDSVTSKPWDEEIGDIPMGPSSTNQSSTAASPMNGTSSGQSGDNAFGSASRSSPVSGAPRPAGYTRHRPWETDEDSDDPRELSSDANAGMSINTTNCNSAYITRGDDTSGISTDDDDDESPTSRYIAAGKKSRRSVKQPVSYAEPSLSAKLRRGDVFFPKVEGEDPNKNYPRASKPVLL